VKPSESLKEQRPALVHNEDLMHGYDDRTPLGPPPAKYTAAVHEKICDELKKGQSKRAAAARAGITEATLHDWLKRGRDGDPHLWQFAEDVEIAQHLFEAGAVETITASALSQEPDKQSSEDAKWMLERTRSDAFSKQVKTTVENQIRDFMIRLEAALDERTFAKVLAVYLGQALPAELEVVGILPENGSTEETDENAEELG